MAIFFTERIVLNLTQYDGLGYISADFWKSSGDFFLKSKGSFFKRLGAKLVPAEKLAPC
jgi:hypothetical protein